MSQSAHLEVVVTSSGVVSADKNLKQLTATSKETETQQQHMAGVFAEIAAAEEKVIKNAVNAAKQAATEKVAAIKKVDDEDDRAAKRTADRAARENERWNDLKQKALARDEARAASAERAAKRIAAAGGLDGVLPKRPSLGRIEGAVGGITEALPGAALLAGGAAGIAAVGVEKLFSTIESGKDKITEAAIEMDNLRARIAGVTGGAGTANEKFEELESMTLGKLPSTVREVSEAFVFLGNTGLANSRDALKSYSNIAAQTGHSLGEVTSAVEHATMGSYKGLREYGIKVQAVGDDLAVTFRGHTETIANSSEAIEGYMQRLGNVEFAGAVERQMDTIGGSVKKQHDAWEDLIDTVAKSSLGDLIKQGMDTATGAVNSATEAVKVLLGTMSKAPPPIKIVEGGKGYEDSIAAAMDARAKIAAANAAKYPDDQKIVAYAAQTAEDARSAHKTATLARQVEEWRAAEVAKWEVTRKFLDDLDGRAMTKKQRDRAKLDEDLAGIRERKEAGSEFDEAAAIANANAAYRNATTKSQTGYTPNIGTSEDSGYARYQAMRVKQDADDLHAVHEALNKKEDAERAFYEHNKEILLEAKGDQTAYLQANEIQWELYLAKLSDLKAKAAQEDARKEEAFQKRIRPFGEKPQSQSMAINTKFEGQQIDLRNAFGDRLQEDASNPFADETKIAQQEKYKEKSLAIERERVKEIAALHRQLALQSTQNAEAMFGNLAEAAKNWGGEQSEAYKEMFAIQKAFGVATATVSMGIAIGKAAELGWPDGIPLAIEAAADGAKILSMISSANYAGAHDLGGDIPAGKWGIAGEYGPEIVNGPAHVVSRTETAKMLGGGSQSQAPQNLMVNLGFDLHGEIDRYMSSTRGTKTLNRHITQNARTIRAVAR